MLAAIGRWIVANHLWQEAAPAANPIMKEVNNMTSVEKQLFRLELQVGQLITIIANLNERVMHLEEKVQQQKVISIQARRDKQKVH